MADVKVSKRTLKSIFEESASLDRKLLFKGPDNLRPDSRYAILEVADDHVVFKLLGDDEFVVPYGRILTLTVAKTQLTVRYG